MNARCRLQKGDALVVVDVQNDFLPGGSLAVPDGDQVIPVLNRYVGLFRQAGLPLIATRDWHPADHCSFTAQGGPWPPHCVRGTSGAEIASELQLPDDAAVVSKATNSDADAYSGFDGTDLSADLRSRNVDRIFVGGLATDYCVLATVTDALEAGFDVVVLSDAVRAVDIEPGDGERAMQTMRNLGATMTVVEELERSDRG